jgi:hypothetical protein
MRLEYDLAKSEKNIRVRGLSFSRTVDFEFETADFISDDRKDYGEPRWIAVGYLGTRLHALCFTPKEGGIRVISFRKVNRREAQRYGKALTTAH